MYSKDYGSKIINIDAKKSKAKIVLQLSAFILKSYRRQTKQTQTAHTNKKE